MKNPSAATKAPASSAARPRFQTTCATHAQRPMLTNPNTSEAKRQPIGVSPKRCIAPVMISLPNGGWSSVA